MEFILCYTNKNQEDVWEMVTGEDAMQVRVGDLADELGCDTDDIMCFDKNDQW